MTLEQLMHSPCGKKALRADPEIQDLLAKMSREGALGSPAAPKSRKAKALDITFEWYINSLLSNPSTHLTNAVSNMVPITTRVFETAMSATSSLVFRNASDRTLYREVLAEASGLAEGWVEAFRFLRARVKAVSKTNEQMLTQQHLPEKLAAQAKIERRLQALSSKNFDINAQWLNKSIDFMGSMVNIPGKALSTSDTFFKIINYRAEIAKQAFHQASTAADEAVVMGGKQATSKELWDSYRSIKTAALDNPDSEIVAKGIADADFRTYTNKPQGAVNEWMALKGHEAPGLRWFVPFRRTMTNIINYGLESTPIAAGLSSKTRTAIMKGTPAERDAAIGRMAAGTGFITAMYFMLGDRLDGEPPMNPQARDLWEKDGHKRDSIRVGDANVPIEMLGQFGTLIKAMAQYKSAVSNIDYGEDDGADRTTLELAELLGFSVADALLSDHWISSLSDGLSSIKESTREDSPRALYTFAAKFGAGFIPSGIKKGPTRWADPNVKDITNPFDAIVAKLTFASRSVENKVDLWGDDMRYDHFLDPSLANKITGKDPVSVEMRRVRMRIPETRRTQGKVKMTSQEYKQFQVYRGKGAFGLPPLRDELAIRMSSSLYKSFDTDKGRSEYLREAILMYGRMARDAVLQDPRFNLAERIQKQAELEQQQLGVSL